MHTLACPQTMTHSRRTSSLVSFLFLFAWTINLVAALAASSSSFNGVRDHDRTLALSMVQNTIKLSKLSKNNVTAAEEACTQWEDILLRNEQNLERNVVALCHALHASCLVRVGKDEEAVDAYDSALYLKNCLDINTRDDLIFGKAQALQRLLRYHDARDQYLELSSEKGAVGAATCSLRIGEADSAKSILIKFCNDEKSTSKSVSGMLGTLKYLDTGELHKTLPFVNAASDLPLYRWINYVLSGSIPSLQLRNLSDEDAFLSLIRINLCPFDDATLVLLDDKINLHDTLTMKSDAPCSFWPTGFVFPREREHLNELVNEGGECLWISKLKAGYGSHGNQILSNVEVLSKSESHGKEYLIQRMVEPLLLLNGRKFSLRIYVVYFSPDEVYISSQGLVKLASIPLSDTKVNDSRMHMTNSGREMNMVQYDLNYLRTEFENASLPFDQLWHLLKSAVDEVFQRFEKVRSSQELTTKWNTRREEIGIPKILGFDFVVDDESKPWLVEVNRFPGLEPRDESDLAVKHGVVYDAWKCAGRKLNLKAHPIEDILVKLFRSGPSSNSLERIYRDQSNSS